MMQSLEEEIKSTTGGARRKSDEKQRKVNPEIPV